MKTMITSMNIKLYHLYGENFINSWAENAGHDLNLIVCFEGDMAGIKEIKHDKINIIPIASDLHDLFVRKFGNFSEAKGLTYTKTDKFPGVATFKYNYRYDAIRFAFKIFSIFKCLELKLINNDFAWIDADIVCKKNFSSSDLDQFFPDENSLASYLGRDDFPQPIAYSECGFVGFNFKHPKCINFLEEFLNLYLTGDIFLLKEWHDSYIFDVVRRSFEERDISFKNMSSHIENEEHPFMKTNLGLFFDHLKGPVRKKQGHS